MPASFGFVSPVDERADPPRDAEQPEEHTLPNSMPEYGDREYWDTRYARDEKIFEWYLGYHGLSGVLDQYMPKDDVILQIGVGTSCIQAEMAYAGYKRIHSIDYSAVCIERLQGLHSDLPQLSYEVADCRTLDAYEDGSFGSVLDKGTLDAILCGTDAADNANALLAQTCRLLRPGGHFVEITYGSPTYRLPYLGQPQYDWDVLAHTLKVPEDDELRNNPENIQIAGPYTAEVLETMDYDRQSYFIYCCRKRDGEAVAASPE